MGGRDPVKSVLKTKKKEVESYIRKEQFVERVTQPSSAGALVCEGAEEKTVNVSQADIRDVATLGQLEAVPGVVAVAPYLSSEALIARRADATQGISGRRGYTRILGIDPQVPARMDTYGYAVKLRPFEFQCVIPA